MEGADGKRILCGLSRGFRDDSDCSRDTYIQRVIGRIAYTRLEKCSGIPDDLEAVGQKTKVIQHDCKDGPAAEDTFHGNSDHGVEANQIYDDIHIAAGAKKSPAKGRGIFRDSQWY